MTVHEEAADGAGVLAAQLASIQTWLALRQVDQTRLVPPQHASREQHQELRTRAAALRVEAAALRQHCSRGEYQPVKSRVVLVHRNTWLTGKLRQGLTDLGVHVAATAVDGAVGCGIAIAEAPDLVFLEANMPTFSGAEVMRRVLRCSPATTLTAQLSYPAQGHALLDAGAAAVWPRQVPPADLVQALFGLLPLRQRRMTTDRQLRGQGVAPHEH